MRLLRARHHGTGGEAAPALAQIGEAQDAVGEIATRRQLEHVHTRIAKAGAKTRLALLGGLDEAAPKAAVVRIDEDLLTRFGILHGQQAEVGELVLERI